MDEGGVALAAIQGLNQEMQEQTEQIKNKDAEIRQLQETIDQLKTIVSRLDQGKK